MLHWISVKTFLKVFYDSMVSPGVSGPTPCFTILWFSPVYQAQRRTTIYKHAKTASYEVTTYNKLAQYYTSKTFYNETVSFISGKSNTEL
jgi:hypothetical protein